MKQQAKQLGVDLLLVDTGSYKSDTYSPPPILLTSGAGDLHDGNGLSDTTSPDAAISNPIFEKVDYDLLTIGKRI